MNKSLIRFFATGLGLGYMPLMPGTFGSLLGVLCYYLLRNTGFVPYLIITLIVSVFAIFISTEAEKIFGEKDCQKIVIDEVAGQMMAFLFITFTFEKMLIGFLLFRFFDMVKIFPANWAQKELPRGYGVVVDDLFAGLQAALILFLIPLMTGFLLNSF